MRIEFIADRHNNDFSIGFMTTVKTRVRVYGFSIGPPVWWWPKFFRDDGPSKYGEYFVRRVTFGWLLFAARRHEVFA